MSVRLRIASFATIPWQCLLLIITSAITIYLFQAPLTKFNPIGRKSFVLPLTPEIMKKWGKEPARVKTGLMIYEFIKFEPLENDFLMSGVIWFEFDPAKVSLETINKFEFNKGTFVQKSEPLIKKISDTATYAQYHFRVQFSALLDYSLFPFDDHIISLNLINNSVEAPVMVYDATVQDFTIPSYVFLSGWKIMNHETRSGYNELTLTETSKTTLQPKVVFSLSIKKQQVRLLLLLLLPLLFLFFLSLFTLSIKDFSLNVEAIIMLVTAFMASAIVTQGMSPHVNYFMAIDYLMVFFLLAMFFTFVIDFLGQTYRVYVQSHTYGAIKGMTVIMMHLLLIAMIYYITHIYYIAK